MTTKPKHPTIPMTAVKSALIESIGHQGSVLAVKFKSGATYHYPDVTADQFAGLQKAESLGKAFGAFKVGRKFTKLEA